MSDDEDSEAAAGAIHSHDDDPQRDAPHEQLPTTTTAAAAADRRGLERSRRSGIRLTSHSQQQSSEDFFIRSVCDEHDEDDGFEEDLTADMAALVSALSEPPSNLSSGGAALSIPASFSPKYSSFLDPNPLWQSTSSEDQAEQLTAADSSRPYSQLLPLSAIPVNDEVNILDGVVEELIEMLKPHDAQITFRKSVRSFIAKQVRKTLSSRVVETGIHAINSFLPDDVLRLAVVIWRGHSAQWQAVLSDRFSRLAAASEGDAEALEMIADEEDCQSVGDLSETTPYSKHSDNSLKSIVINTSTLATGSHSPDDCKLQILVDGFPVEIFSNPRDEICLLALFEDVSILVKKDFLFKRSLLLIRAWWVYETTSYIGCPMKHYLSDMAITVMVCAIFNQYHLRIHQPVQALCYFLAEYSSFDWSKNAISLQGIVPFPSDSDSQPFLRSADLSDLVTDSLLSKYLEVINSSFVSSTSSIPHTPLPSTSLRGTEASVGTIGDALSSSTSNKTTANFQSNPTNAPSFDAIKNELAPLQKFERREINIVHPLSVSNMVTDKLNTRRAKRIIKVFQMGARNLHTTLRTIYSGATLASLPINNFFRGIVSRFSNGWRPDVWGNSLPSSLSGAIDARRYGWKKNSLQFDNLRKFEVDTFHSR